MYNMLRVFIFKTKAVCMFFILFFLILIMMEYNILNIMYFIIMLLCTFFVLKFRES